MQNRAVVLLALAVAIGFMAGVSFMPDLDGQQRQFRRYMDTYQKSYKTQDEFDFRFKIYQGNMARIVQLNQANPLASFGENKFTDMMKEEVFKNHVLISYYQQHKHTNIISKLCHSINAL